MSNTKIGGILMIKWLKTVFCKHEWEDRLIVAEFAIVSGDRFNIVCNKCGKVKGSYFRKYNENGTGYI